MVISVSLWLVYKSPGFSLSCTFNALFIQSGPAVLPQESYELAPRSCSTGTARAVVMEMTIAAKSSSRSRSRPGRSAELWPGEEIQGIFLQGGAMRSRRAASTYTSARSSTTEQGSCQKGARERALRAFTVLPTDGRPYCRLSVASWKRRPFAYLPTRERDHRAVEVHFRAGCRFPCRASDSRRRSVTADRRAKSADLRGRKKKSARRLTLLIVSEDLLGHARTARPHLDFAAMAKDGPCEPPRRVGPGGPGVTVLKVQGGLQGIGERNRANPKS